MYESEKYLLLKGNYDNLCINCALFIWSILSMCINFIKKLFFAYFPSQKKSDDNHKNKYDDYEEISDPLFFNEEYYDYN